MIKTTHLGHIWKSIWWLRQNENENNENFQSGSEAALEKLTETEAETIVKMDGPPWSPLILTNSIS